MIGTVPDSSAPDAKPARAGWSGAPALTLLLLSPIIGEILFGATRVSTLFVLVPQIGTWGCISLIIREVARRNPPRWIATLLLGVAAGLAEECLIQQTSVAPLVGVAPDQVYGRVLGVNWPYLLWSLGYEAVWIIIIPIQLTELIFPARRHDSWLGPRSTIACAMACAIASFVAWYTWTQLYVPRFFPEWSYRVPRSAVVLTLLAILALVVLAVGPRPWWLTTRRERPVPARAILAMLSFGAGLLWFAVLFLAYGALPSLAPAIPLFAGVLVALLALDRITRWSHSGNWHDSERLATVSGTLLASMMAGFVVLYLGSASALDVFGKLAINILAVYALVDLGRKADTRVRSTERQSPSIDCG